MDFWEALLANLDISLLIFARMLGIFSFNPILSRNNIPVMVRVGISLMLTAILTAVLDFDYAVMDWNTGVYVMNILKELLIGVILGAVCDMFIFSVQIAGEIMDAQAGLGMAKVFDPSTKIQMSIFGSIISFMMYLYFFATNSHLTLVKIFVDSYEVIPIGTGYINADIGWAAIEMFSQVLVLVLKLAMPVIAAELIVEICVGLLMKTVPQIQIMVVNIQLKVVFGFLILYAIAAPIAEFVDKYIDNMLNSCRDILPQIFV
ncbi:MAG: flagellar biosynthetic protein FliR [Huintestinicola sp.]